MCIVLVMLLYSVSVYSIDSSSSMDILILYNWIIKGIIIALLTGIIGVLVIPYISR